MPHPVDINAGRKLRQRRTELGISQDALGKEVGVTFQQIQKYEKGINRMSLSKAYDFSIILEVPPAYFFDKSDSKMPVVDRYLTNLIADYNKNTPEMQKILRSLVKNCVRLTPPGADAYKGEK